MADLDRLTPEIVDAQLTGDGSGELPSESARQASKLVRVLSQSKEFMDAVEYCIEKNQGKTGRALRIEMASSLSSMIHEGMELQERLTEIAKLEELHRHV